MRTSVRALLLLSLALPCAAGAQTIRGTVSSGTVGAGVEGVVLELFDSTASRVATALTGPRGAFLLRATGPGTYRLDARRIGFRRRSFGPFSIAGDTTLAITLEQLPQILPAVTADERSRCRQRDGDVSAISVLWESANTALLASAVTMRDGGFEFDLATQYREYALDPTTLIDVDVEFQRLRDVKPWTALPAEDIRRYGFVHVSADQALTFAAPDLEVLTDPSFSLSHCFSVREHSRRPELLGLNFGPDEGVRRADVRGTLWLERQSLILRSLEFEFTGTHFRGLDSLAGGRIDFAQLAGGLFFPTEWVIRSPVPPVTFIDAVVRRGRRQGAGAGAVALSPSDPPWETRRVVVNGASVIALRRAAGADTAALWARAPGGVDVEVRWRRGSRGPADGARVMLVGLNSIGYANDSGRVTFARVPPGDYILETTSDVQDLLRLPRDIRTVRVTDGEDTTARLAALPDYNAINSMCAFNGHRAVVGGVIERDGKPVTWARVRAAYASIDAQGRRQLDYVRSGWSRDGGRYLLCRIPRGRPMVIIARFDDGTTVEREVMIPDRDPAVPPSYLVRADFIEAAPVRRQSAAEGQR